MQLEDLTLGYNSLRESLMLGKEKSPNEWCDKPKPIDWTMQVMCAFSSLCLDYQEKGKECGFEVNIEGKTFQYVFTCKKEEVKDLK